MTGLARATMSIVSNPVESSSSADATERLRSVAHEATAAEDREDWWAADDAWRRYRLISDSRREPDELLAEGVRLSRLAISLADQA